MSEQHVTSVIDYKSRAEFWRDAAQNNLDMLADANKRLREYERYIAALHQRLKETV